MKPVSQPLQNLTPAPRLEAEISLETLELLLTSVPDNEICERSFPRSSDQHDYPHIQNVIRYKSHYLKRMQHLIKRQYGAEWLYRNLSYFQTQFPWEVISLLENMAYENRPDITEDICPPSSYSQQQPVRMEGLEILTTNIRRSIFNNLDQPLNLLTEEFIDNCSSSELHDWNNWCADIEKHLHQIDQQLKQGQRFFSVNNFQRMLQLPLSRRGKIALEQLLDKIIPQTSNLA